MQLKDISTLSILEFLHDLPNHEHEWKHWAEQGTWFWDDTYKPSNSICNVMPEGANPKMMRLKMGKLIKQGLVDGCACGCRGEFKLTEKGRLLVTTSYNYPLAKIR